MAKKKLTKLIESLIEGAFFNFIYSLTFRYADIAIGKLSRFILSSFSKVDNRKIVLYALQGDYTCNIKAIAEELLLNYPEYRLVWIIPDKNMKNSKHFPSQIKLVQSGTFECYHEMATAKIWINNSLDLLTMHKKKNQLFLQTWHGSLGIKQLGGWVPVTTGKQTKLIKRSEEQANYHWFKNIRVRTRKTDYCISNSSFETNLLYKYTYWNNIPVLEYGHPRNDVLLSKDETKLNDIRSKVRQFFDLSPEDHLVLYAPTFREHNDVGCFGIDYMRLIDTLERKFGGNWKVLARMHYFTELDLVCGFNKHMVLDASGYPDIQDLLVTADIGITDYSSWIFDFMLTKKPGFIYAPDMNAYDHERGLYYPLESTPFPVASNNDLLLSNVSEFDASAYSYKVDQFLMEKGCIDDGLATDRVVKLINKATAVYGQ